MKASVLMRMLIRMLIRICVYMLIRMLVCLLICMRTSGAAYSSVPQLVKLRIEFVFLEKPKSHSRTYPSVPTSTFSSFTSR